MAESSNLSDTGDEEDDELVDPGNDSATAYDDEDDIQKALRRLEESRNMLDDLTVLRATVSAAATEYYVSEI